MPRDASAGDDAAGDSAAGDSEETVDYDRVMCVVPRRTSHEFSNPPTDTAIVLVLIQVFVRLTVNPCIAPAATP